MDHDWGQVYLYVASKTYSRWRKNEVPEDIRVESLTDEQMRDFNRLKGWLLRKRTQARIDKERTERRERKKEEVARRKAEQPALFRL